MRELVRVSTSSPTVVMAELEEALRGTGPAIFPVADGSLENSPLEFEGFVNDDVAVVIETSGSSGVPKRVGLSAAALLASARATHGRLGGPGQWLLALPLHYIAGLQVVVRSLDSGIEPVMMGSGGFTPEGFVRLVATMQEGRRYSSLVPAQLQRLIEFARSSESVRGVMASLDAVLVGGQSTPPALVAEAAGMGIPVVTTYGSSETSGGCVYDGIALEGVIVEVNEGGEVCIGGNILATEYISGEPSRASFYEREGQRFYATGDLGRLETGRLIVTGRLDRVLISGGIKVALDAIEACVSEAKYPTAVSVAVDDPAWGQRPVLVVEGSGDASDEEQLRAIIQEQLGKVAVPDRIVWVVSLPRLASGKPDLVAIAALATS